MSTTPIPDFEELRRRIKRAQNKVSALCDGERWVMSVPALHDSDPDLVITDGLMAGIDATASAETLARELDRMRARVHAGIEMGIEADKRAETLAREKAELVEKVRGLFDFRAHLQRQREFSEKTFGPGDRAKGVVAHIRKELTEIEAAPGDLTEWIDVAILALDGAWRSGADPDQIIAALVAKQTKNEARQWPDWRTMSPDQAIEHTKPAACPSCGSRAPDLHPAVQSEGEVHICSDPFHARALSPEPTGDDNG